MSDSPEHPRKLLRWAEDGVDDPTQTQGPGYENTNEGSEEGMSEQIGTENPDAIVPPKREDWYGTKMKRLKDNVEKLRQELRDKERDYIRLKNKYNVSKRRQEELQKDLTRHTKVKLDTDSDVELLRLQLLEKEKELSQCVVASRQDGQTTPEKHSGNASDVERSLESYLALGDSYLARKYLNFHKDVRCLFVYGILGAACFLSVVAHWMGSHMLSTITVALWTLGLFCLWQERKETVRSLKLIHLKKVREMSVQKSQLVEEKRKLGARKDELVKELAKEVEDQVEISSKLTKMSDKFDEELAKNEELVNQEKSTFQELQSERVRRRRAEEELQEASARALLARKQDEDKKCGNVCRELRESLKTEREENEKLGRENQRLIEDIVEMNMKEEKSKMEMVEEKVVEKEREERSKEEQRKMEMVEEKVVEKERKEIRKEKGKLEREKVEEKVVEKDRGKEEMVNTQKGENDFKLNGGIKSEETKTERPESKCAAPKMEARPRSQVTSSAIASQTTPRDMDKNVPNGGLIISPMKHCVLCSFEIPTEVRVALYVVFLACLILLLQFVFSSKVYLFACLLFMALAGALGYYRVTLTTTGDVQDKQRQYFK